MCVDMHTNLVSAVWHNADNHQKKRKKKILTCGNSQAFAVEVNGVNLLPNTVLPQHVNPPC